MSSVLDVASLRATFCLVAVALLVLSWSVTYRSTRSPYSGWWCGALLAFLAGSGVYLLDGTPHQWWADPLGNALVLAGAAGVWTAARSLRSAPPSYGVVGVVIAAALGASSLHQPGANSWSGGGVFLAGMTLLFALTAGELWRLGSGSSGVHVPMAGAATLSAAYYAARLVAFLVLGPQHPDFSGWFGSEATTLVTIVLLVVVSFTVTGLSNEQMTSEWRRRATHDPLTHLLNRAGFVEQAGERLRGLRRDDAAACLVVADADHFKALNDERGHQAGDLALRAFAEACTDTLRSTDLVARYGGEEFVLLLHNATALEAEEVTRRISARLREAGRDLPYALPTISYGIAAVDPREPDLEATMAVADAALYRAKALGRDRAVIG